MDGEERLEKVEAFPWESARGAVGGWPAEQTQTGSLEDGR